MSQPPSYTEIDPSPITANANEDRFRPGRFDDLDGFIRAQGAFFGPPDYSTYREVQFVNPEPGAIVHIIDGRHASHLQDSRLHQRVMLVIRHENPSPMTMRAMTCIPLCAYEDYRPKTDGQYWNVQQEFEQTAKVNYRQHAQYPVTAIPTSRSSLTVSLRKNTYLESGIMANLEELWRVEHDRILLDKIGQVSDESFILALRSIRELFARPPTIRCHRTAGIERPAELKEKKRVVAVGNSRNGHWERRSQH